MAQLIVLAPDLYYRNWEPGGSDGELWLVLRPHVACGPMSDAMPLGTEIANFEFWAKHSLVSVDAQGNSLFDYRRPDQLQLNQIRCSSDKMLLHSVNLPADVDVEVIVGRGAEFFSMRRERSTGLMLGGRGPFSYQFNAKFKDELNSAALGKFKRREMDLAILSFIQTLDAGRRVRFSANPGADDYLDRNFDEPMPRFGEPKSGVSTSLYWCMGLMFQLGTQKELAKLRSIDSVEIVLAARAQNRNPPREIQRLFFPDAFRGMDVTGEYFSEIDVGFKRGLKASRSDRKGVRYVNPGFRSLTPPSSGSRIWLIEGAVATDFDHDAPTATTRAGRKSTAAGIGRLSLLAGIEARSALRAKPESVVPGVNATTDQREPLPNEAIGSRLVFKPGIHIAGRLEPYRKYPAPPGAAGDAALQTLVVFRPDKPFATLLELLLSTAIDQVRSAVEASTDISGWQLRLVHAGNLPWDGPDLQLKLLAKPTTAAIVAGQPRTLTTAPFSFFVPATRAGLEAMAVGDSNGQDPYSRHLWVPRLPADANPAALVSYWAAQAPNFASGQPINAVLVEGLAVGVEAAGLHVVFIDQFSLAAAESKVRLEQVLTVLVEPGAPSSDPGGFRRPAEDYQDNLINFNSAVMVGAAGSALQEDHLRTPKAITYEQATHPDPAICRVGLSNTQQTIPLLHGWPRDPCDPAGPEPVAGKGDRSGRGVRPVGGVSWQEIRVAVAANYGYARDTDGDEFALELEYTYGDRLPLTENGGPLRVQRSTVADWPVQLASEPDARSDGEKDSCRDVPLNPFLSCVYRAPPDKGGVDELVVTFDESHLLGNAARGAVRAEDQQRIYVATLAAWRAVAELASRSHGVAASKLRLWIEAAVFSVESALRRHAKQMQLPVDPAQFASALARGALNDAWAKSIAVPEKMEIAAVAVEPIRLWARKLISGVEQPGKQSRSFRIPIGGALPLGSVANVARACLEVSRPAWLAPQPASSALLPSSQTPGGFHVAPQTLASAWAACGFGPSVAPLNGGIPVVGAALVDAHQHWVEERTKRTDSITVDHRFACEAAADDPSTRTAAAVVAALPGSDWFIAEGPGPLGLKDRALRPVVLPIGFAPPRPREGFGSSAQLAMDRLMQALQDTIDVAYFAWTSRSEVEWADHFKSLSESGAARKRFDLLLTRLTSQLLLPQPHATATANEKRVRELAGAARNKQGHFASLNELVSQRLSMGPAMYANSRALLLTAMEFIEAASEPKPMPTALARAQFSRKVAGRTSQATNSSGEPTTVTLADLVLVDPDGGFASQRALGFLESLDSARYGSEFDLGSDECVAESFEHVVDPDPKSKAPRWSTLPMLLPLASENGGAKSRRRVHLASRQAVVAPVLVWSGENDGLRAALLDAAASTKTWRLSDITGRPSESGVGLRLTLRLPRGNYAPEGEVDRGTAFLLFAVNGDEDTPGTVVSAFANDGFFLHLETNATATVLKKDSNLDEAFERQMRLLSSHERRSNDAAESIANLFFRANVVDEVTFTSSVTALCETDSQDLPPLQDVLVRVRAQNLQAGGGEETKKRLADAVLFVPRVQSTPGAEGGMAKSALLLIALQTGVWRPIDATVRHGRNLPYERWGDVGTGSPWFAPEFWLGAAQAAAPTRFALVRQASNGTAQWKKAGHTVELEDSWRGMHAVGKLLLRMLRAPGVLVGEGTADHPVYGGRNGVLGSDAEASWLNAELNVVVYHEQFEDDPDRAQPVSRFPLSIYPPNSATVASEADKMEWFPAGYDHFSVDFQWYAPSGTSLLRLERMFVVFKPKS
jgi:hypothetical protein